MTLVGRSLDDVFSHVSVAPPPPQQVPRVVRAQAAVRTVVQAPVALADEDDDTPTETGTVPAVAAVAEMATRLPLLHTLRLGLATWTDANRAELAAVVPRVRVSVAAVPDEPTKPRSSAISIFGGE